MKFENCKYDNVQLAAQFIKMAEKFLPYANNETCVLDMDEAVVIKHTCGTVACHGGYAAIIFNTGGGYLHGALALAKYLGFNSEDSLESWAGDNYYIWGNDFGDNMFCSSSAFVDGYYSNDINEANLTNVVERYLAVAKRLLELPSDIVLTN